MKTIMSVLVVELQCPCNPGFKYASQCTYISHHKSKRHIAWQNLRTEREIRLELARREKEIGCLKRQIECLQERISLLENTFEKQETEDLLDLYERSWS